MDKLNAKHLKVGISEPFTVCRVDEEKEPGWFRIHPSLKRLPNGRLILSVNRNRDITDAELLMYESNDGGHSWQESVNWPTSSRRGGHLPTTCVALENDEVLVVCSSLILAAGQAGEYFLATWRSFDGGATWGDMEAARLEMPMGEPFDIYNPPPWFLEQHAEKFQHWRKPQAPPAVQAICDQLGHRRLPGIFNLFALGGSRLLGFAYFAPKYGEPYSVHCISSEDAGRSWRHLSTPGPFDARYRTENHLSHKIDGLCESSCKRLKNGDLFLVMRLGSRHPLYSSRSSDEGRTWTPPRPLPVYGILPTVETLPGGVVALCSGRSDVSLSFSLDGGYRWPWTYRFLEDGKPEDPSTRNNTMLQVEPGRLLYMYDHGGYHPNLPLEFHGPRRIVGHFIDVETNC